LFRIPWGAGGKERGIRSKTYRQTFELKTNLLNLRFLSPFHFLKCGKTFRVICFAIRTQKILSRASSWKTGATQYLWVQTKLGWFLIIKYFVCDFGLVNKNFSITKLFYLCCIIMATFVNSLTNVGISGMQMTSRVWSMSMVCRVGGEGMSDTSTRGREKGCHFLHVIF